MFTLTSSPSMDCDDEDGEVSGGFYSQDFESVDQLNLDLDASSHQNAVTIDQFIDTKNLTSNHVLSPPGNFSREESGGESFVQHAQEQFDAGEKVKFTDGIKAKQHFSLAALYFQRAAEGISNSDIIVSTFNEQLICQYLCLMKMKMKLTIEMMCNYLTFVFFNYLVYMYHT